GVDGAEEAELSGLGELLQPGLQHPEGLLEGAAVEEDEAEVDALRACVGGLDELGEAEGVEVALLGLVEIAAVARDIAEEAPGGGEPGLIADAVEEADGALEELLAGVEVSGASVDARAADEAAPDAAGVALGGEDLKGAGVGLDGALE